MIRGGRIGRTVLQATAWVMVAAALVAAIVGRRTRALELGVIAVGCAGALLLERTE